MRRLSVLPGRERCCLAGLSVLALTLTSSSFGVVNLNRPTGQLRDFDSRGKVAPTKAQLSAARSIHGRVSWGSLGTPASIIRYHGYLAAGLKAPSAESAALNWLAVHRATFGLRSVKHLRVLTAAPLRGSKAHAVSFRQTFGGALSADGVVTVTVVPAKTGWKVVYASSSLARDQRVVGKRALSPVGAWVKAANAAGIHVSDVAALGKTPDGSTAVSASGLSGSETVRPTVFGTAKKGAIRAYDTTVTRSIHGAQDSYRVIVDAATGKLLYRQNLVDNLADDPVWSAFPIAPPFNPINAFPWNYPSTDTRQTYCWTATAGCTNVVSDNPATTVYPFGVASKFQWDIPMDVLGVQGTPQSTVGNNVDEALLWSGGGRSYNNPANPRPISPTPRLHGSELPVHEPVVHTAGVTRRR